MFIRSLFPCLIVIAFSVLALGAYVFSPQTPGTSGIIETIQKADEHTPVQPLVEQAWAALQFQEASLTADAEGPQAFPLANLYFQLGEALLNRGDNTLLPQAIRAYEETVRLQPAIHHGWPYFQTASAYERLGNLEQAHTFYDKVLNHDFGELSLRAHYRLASIALRRGHTEIEAYPVYSFLRYGRRGGLDSLQPFRETSFVNNAAGHNYAEALNALLLSITQAREESINRLSDYLQEYPQDHAMRYYYDQLQDSVQALYPADMNLLRSYYGPQVLRNGVPRLIDKGHLIADYYLGNADISLELRIEINNPNGHAGEVIVQHHGHTELFELNETRLKIELPLPPVVGKNVVDLHFFNYENGQTNSLNWVEVQRMQLAPARGAANL